MGHSHFKGFSKYLPRRLGTYYIFKSSAFILPGHCFINSKVFLVYN